MAGMIVVEETPEQGDNEVFVSTGRGRAAFWAAAEAIAAVELGMGVRRAGVYLLECREWEPDTIWDAYLSVEAKVINNLVAPKGTCACRIDEYEPFCVEHVNYWHYSAAWGSIQFWDDCHFELYKVRTLRFLTIGNRTSAILALARELLTREEVPSDDPLKWSVVGLAQGILTHFPRLEVTRAW